MKTGCSILTKRRIGCIFILLLSVPILVILAPQQHIASMIVGEKRYEEVGENNINGFKSFEIQKRTLSPTVPYANIKKQNRDKTNSKIEESIQNGNLFNKSHWIYVPVSDDLKSKIENNHYVLNSCVPKACSNPKHLLSMKNKWDEILALASFPGSGNTWTRYILQEGSRVYTSSVFCDTTLLDSGFPVECNREPYAFNRVIAVKSHYPAFKASTFRRAHMPGPSAGVIIVRAPFDAILSYYTLKSARKFTGDFHKLNLPKRMFVGNKFKSFVMRATKNWRRHAMQLNGNWPLGFEARKNLRLLLIYYEDLVRNPVESYYKIFAFIKSNLGFGGRMPEINEALICALRHSSGNEQRSHKEIFNPFTPEMVGFICNETKFYWNENVWGDCESGLLQSQRQNITYAPKLYVPDIPCNSTN